MDAETVMAIVTTEAIVAEETVDGMSVVTEAEEMAEMRSVAQKMAAVSLVWKKNMDEMKEMVPVR
jgi:hypothetical protein